MTPEQIANRKIWTDALRSGKFEQGKLELCNTDKDGQKKYCCLGVANEVIPELTRDRNGACYLEHETANKLLGLDLLDQVTLADKNDDGVSFSEIADYIEAM